MGCPIWGAVLGFWELSVHMAGWPASRKKGWHRRLALSHVTEMERHYTPSTLLEVDGGFHRLRNYRGAYHEEGMWNETLVREHCPLPVTQQGWMKPQPIWHSDQLDLERVASLGPHQTLGGKPQHFKENNNAGCVSQYTAAWNFITYHRLPKRVAS